MIFRTFHYLRLHFNAHKPSAYRKRKGILPGYNNKHTDINMQLLVAQTPIYKNTQT